MSRPKLLYITFLLFLTLGKFSAQQLEFSLLTCDSGDELYSTFGHSAIRMNQIGFDVDVVFNYGMFDPSVDGFYFKFMRRDVPYFIAATDYKSFINEYTYEKRSVVEQKLNLDSLEEATLLKNLRVNLQKANKYYPYDFFYDNCSTRIIDILQKSVGGEIEYGPKFNEQASLRNLLDEQLSGKPWSDYGIDLVIGARADKIANIEEQMFLPRYLSQYVGQSTLDGQALTQEKTLLLDYTLAAEERSQVSWVYKPTSLYYLLLLVEFTLFFLFRKRKHWLIQSYDFLWYLGLSTISLVIVFLWFFTAHEATKANWNLLWISPLYFFILLPRWRRSGWGSKLSLILLGLTLLCLLGWYIIPQQFHIAFLPMMVISVLKILRGQYMAQDRV